MLGKVPLGPKRSINKAIIVIIKPKDLGVDMQLLKKMKLSQELAKDFFKIQCLKARRAKLNRPRKYLKRYIRPKWVKWLRWSQVMQETVGRTYKDSMDLMLAHSIMELLAQIN